MNWCGKGFPKEYGKALSLVLLKKGLMNRNDHDYVAELTAIFHEAASLRLDAQGSG